MKRYGVPIVLTLAAAGVVALIVYAYLPESIAVECKRPTNPIFARRL